MAYRWMPAQGNLLTLCGEAALTIGPSFDTLTPDAQAMDGRPSTPVRFGAKSGECSLGVTLNLLRNPGFELEDLSNWPVLSGSSERTTDESEVYQGTASLRFNNAVRYQDILIPSGIPFTVRAALRGDAFGAAYVVVLNLDTGRFLSGLGTWVTATATRTLERTAASWAEQQAAATVEPFETTGRYLTRLRIHVGGEPDEGSQTFVDEVVVRPWWNFIGLFGHNLTSRGEFRSPGTAFSHYGQVPRYEYQSEDTIRFGWVVPGAAEDFVDGQSYAIPSPNTWNVVGPRSSTYVTVAVLSDQYAHYPPVSFGELVVGWVEDLAPAQYPMSLRLAEVGQVRNETPAGDLFAYTPSANPLRELTLRFIYDSASAERIIREKLYKVSRGGVDGLILVPPAELATQVGCIFGVPDRDFSMSIDTTTTGGAMVRTASIVIRELPSPQTTAV